MLKIKNLNRFNEISKFMDECFRVNSESRKASNLINFVEIYVWENILHTCQLKPENDK